ncbi:MAG: response regulator [Caldilineaceae bacterium]
MAAQEEAEAQPSILVVDRSQRNLELLAQFLSQAGYQVLAEYDLDESSRVLDAHAEIGLALINLSGFDRRIWDLCEQVRTKGMPLLVISPKQSVAIELESRAHGAQGVLTKPLVVRELLALIHRLLED